MCTYLHKAPNGVYYFRMGIPVELRPRFDGKREIKFSLGTKDRDTAKRLIPDQTKAAQRQIEQARASTVPAPKPAPARSPAQLARDRQRWEFDQEQEDLASEAYIDADLEIAELEPVMDALSAGQVPDAAPQDVARAAQLALAHEREMAAIKIEQEANKRIARIAPLVPGEAILEPKVKGIYLDTDIVVGWAAERNPSAKGKAAYLSSVNLLHSIMGRKSVELISKADAMAYKQRLIADPARSQVNVRDHLGYLRTLLDWAAQNDEIEANPVKDVRMRVTDKGEARKDFDIDDLTALLAGPVHANGERPSGCGGEAAYWLPLLALLMGARREELGQLRVSDVRQAPYVDGDEIRQQVWCIDITDTPDDGEGLANQVKNAASRRLIPLHPKLIELGFIRYVQGLANQQGRVFPELKPVGVGQKLTDKWGQWFGRYKRQIGITDRTKVFHSFRHTWKTYAVDAGIAERVCREFQGHEGKDAADKYGAAPSMAKLVEAIASYRVPGLIFPPAPS